MGPSVRATEPRKSYFSSTCNRTAGSRSSAFRMMQCQSRRRSERQTAEKPSDPVRRFGGTSPAGRLLRASRRDGASVRDTRRNARAARSRSLRGVARRAVRLQLLTGLVRQRQARMHVAVPAVRSCVHRAALVAGAAPCRRRGGFSLGVPGQSSCNNSSCRPDWRARATSVCNEGMTWSPAQRLSRPGSTRVGRARPERPRRPLLRSEADRSACCSTIGQKSWSWREDIVDGDDRLTEQLQRVHQAAHDPRRRFRKSRPRCAACSSIARRDRITAACICHRATPRCTVIS